LYLFSFDHTWLKLKGEIKMPDNPIITTLTPILGIILLALTIWALVLLIKGRPRFLAIYLMSLTALFTIMEGAGTTCVALAAEEFGDSFAKLADYQWLYILFVIGGIAIGVMMFRAVYLLAKVRANAYRYSIISLILGILIGGIHMAVSRSLRGSSMPVDGVVYVTILTLIVFLLFRIRDTWKKLVSGPNDDGETNLAGGAAAIACGATSLTIQYMMASTHTINGVNYGDAFHTSMTLIGWGFILVGISLIASVQFRLKAPSEARLEESRPA
jgi:hypothetical protein